MSILGTRVARTEDARLLTLGGTYVEDVRAPELTGAAQVTFVRSPVAHAMITRIDTSVARVAPGVVAVFTAQDLDQVPPPDAGPAAEPLLAADRVRYVGEPVAMVITDGQYQGEDAAELVSVDYEPLPPVLNVDAALEGARLLFPSAGSNIVASGGMESFDDAPFDGCDIVIEQRVVNQRVAPVPLEVRAAAALWAGDRLTVWASTQNAQLARDVTAGQLGLDPAAVRVIAPDVGGGFGAKIALDRDMIAVAWAARRAGRPVRWVETRSENLVGMTHGRGQQNTIKIGGTRDGRILAYRLDIVQDCGAYARLGPLLATFTQLMTSGPYDIPQVQFRHRAVVTSKTPVAAYRGAGRPEATTSIERAVELFAAAAGLDPADVRRRNLVPPDKFPYQTPGGARYDSGEYVQALDKVLATVDYGELRAEQRRRRERSDPIQLGIGLSSYVEITAEDAKLGETARLAVHGDGTATVYTGSSAHGQGHHTTFAMLVQEELGIPMEKITVVHGDTDAVPKGVGTYASRSLQLGGMAVHQAAAEVKEEARHRAANLMEVSEADLILDTSTGTWQVRGDPETGVTWAEVAAQAGPDGLGANVNFRTERPTFPFGSHVAVTEVDVETGKARLIRHVSVDDAGRVINPILAEGQRHGGIAQGAAQVLMEEVVYDADGNPLTGTLADYAAITPTELPSFELLAMETPTDVNPLGVKGIGEAGTIGSIPAVQNSILDAIAHLGVRHIDMPLTPERVWNAINEARAAQ